MKTLFVVAMLTISLSSCTTIQPVFGPIVYDPAKMEIVGPASATVEKKYVMMVGPTGGNALAVEAVEKAAKSVGADTLINVVADDQKSYVVPFFHAHTLTVKGLAIRYKK